MRFSFLALLVMAATTFTVKAEQKCAQITFLMDKPSQTAELLSVNQVRTIDLLERYRIKAALEGEYKLPAGEYDVSYKRWNKMHLKQLFKERFMGYDIYMNDTGDSRGPDGNLMSQVGNAKLLLEDNFHYQFHVVENDNKELQLQLKNKTAKLCEIDNSYISSEQILNSVKKVKKLPLPQEVNLPMRRLMFEIQSYHESKGLPPNNVISAYLNSNLGIALDGSFTGQGIKFLSITPFSIGQEIGFRSGDILTHIDEKPVNKESFVSELSYYLASLGVMGELNFTMKRKGRKIDLKRAFLPTIYPSIQYTINAQKANSSTLINSQVLPKKLQVRLERNINTIIESISQREDLVNENFVEFSVEPVFDISLGIYGNIIEKTDGKFVFKVDAVGEYTMASNAGIKAGDVLVGINNELFKSNRLSILDTTIKSLMPNETFNINTQNGEVKRVVYKPKKLPGFTFAIDLESEYRTAAMLSNVKSSNYAQRKLKRLGTFSPYKGIGESIKRRRSIDRLPDGISSNDGGSAPDVRSAVSSKGN